MLHLCPKILTSGFHAFPILVSYTLAAYMMLRLCMQDEPMAFSFHDVQPVDRMLTTSFPTQPDTPVIVQHDLSLPLVSDGRNCDIAAPSRPRMHADSDRQVLDETGITAGAFDSAQIDLQGRKQQLEMQRDANEMPPLTSPDVFGSHIPQHSGAYQISQAGCDSEISSSPARRTPVHGHNGVAKDKSRRTSRNGTTKVVHKIQTSHASPRTVTSITQPAWQVQSLPAAGSRIVDQMGVYSQEYAAARSMYETCHQHESSSHAHVRFAVGTSQSRSEKSLYVREQERERGRLRPYGTRQSKRNNPVQQNARSSSEAREAAPSTCDNFLYLTERL